MFDNHANTKERQWSLTCQEAQSRLYFRDIAVDEPLSIPLYLSLSYLIFYIISQICLSPREQTWAGRRPLTSVRINLPHSSPDHPDANIQTVKMGAMMGGSAFATSHTMYDELTST